MSNSQTLQGANLSIDEILSMAQNLPRYAKPEGMYVWKKRDGYIVNLVQLNTSSRPTNLQVVAEGIEVTEIDSLFGVNFIDNTGMVLTIIDSSTVQYVTASGSVNTNAYTWNPSTQIIAINDGWGTIHTFTPNEALVTIGYVVSDDETAYPDGEFHADGYWYELLDENLDLSISGFSTMAVDEFVPSSTIAMTTAVNHSLGTTPKAALLLNMKYPLVNSNSYEAFSSFVALFSSGNYRVTSVFRSGTDLMFEFVASSNITKPTATTIVLGSSGTAKFYAGSKYKLITWA